MVTPLNLPPGAQEFQTLCTASAQFGHKAEHALIVGLTLSVSTLVSSATSTGPGFGWGFPLSVTRASCCKFTKTLRNGPN